MHDHDCSCEHHNHDEPNEKPEDDDFPRDVPLPPPTIISLVSGIASQAMVSMGVFPNPMTGKSTMMLHQAKHLVDTVEMILEKTQGNLDENEHKTMDSVLHELRMIFIAAQKEKEKRNSGQ